MEPWRDVFRRGIAPQCSREALGALRAALAADDPRLMQGCTTTPPPLMAVQDWPCEGACLVSYLGWKGDGLETVGQVKEAFAKLCHQCGVAAGDERAVRHLLNFWDDTPRPEAVAELLAEVDLALSLQPEGV